MELGSEFFTQIYHPKLNTFICNFLITKTSTPAVMSKNHESPCIHITSLKHRTIKYRRAEMNRHTFLTSAIDAC